MGFLLLFVWMLEVKNSHVLSIVMIFILFIYILLTKKENNLLVAGCQMYPNKYVISNQIPPIKKLNRHC